MKYNKHVMIKDYCPLSQLSLTFNTVAVCYTFLDEDLFQVIAEGSAVMMRSISGESLLVSILYI